MSATDELCRMLDERGVEYERNPWSCGAAVWWRDRSGTMWRAHDNEEDELLSLYAYNSVTPEQAIAATLGPGTCKLDPYTDAAFRVVQAAGDTDFIDYAEVCECSACGASVIVPHEYERVTAGNDELWPKFNFCPNCGLRVEVDA